MRYPARVTTSTFERPANGPIPGTSPAPRPERNGRKRLVVVILLLAVSSLMVWGTWAAIDDLQPKSMRADLAVTGGALRLVNTSGFAWTNAVFTINDAYTASWPDRVEGGATLRMPLTTFVDDAGRAMPAGETVREVTAEATRHSSLGRVNGNRPTSGRWPVQ